MLLKILIVVEISFQFFKDRDKCFDFFVRKIFPAFFPDIDSVPARRFQKRDALVGNIYAFHTLVVAVEHAGNESPAFKPGKKPDDCRVRNFQIRFDVFLRRFPARLVQKHQQSVLRTGHAVLLERPDYFLSVFSLICLIRKPAYCLLSMKTPS